MREQWDKAINEIDEKYVSEAAQTHAKNLGRNQEREQYEHEASRPVELKPVAVTKKSSKAKIIGLSAAAAAVVAVGIGGGVMLSRDNDALLPTETPTAEATVEADDFITDEDGIIIFSQNYEEGNITFEEPEIQPATGANVSIASPVTEMTDAELLAYIEGFTTVKADIPHENLLDNGYTFDKERSHYNGMASHSMGEKIGHQVALRYIKGDAEVVVNYGETGSNYAILYLPDGYGGQLIAGDKLSGMLRGYDNNGSTEVYCGGMVIDGVPYFAARTYWYNEETDIRGSCVISAVGCNISDITDILAGVICRSDMLHPVDVKPFSAADYQRIDISYYDDEMTLTDDMIRSLSECLFGASASHTFDGDDLDRGHDAQLKLYDKSSSEDTSVLMLHEGGGKYYYSIGDKDYGDRAYFELTADDYSEVKEWFYSYTPHSFLGTILEEDSGNRSTPETGDYIIRSNEGEVYWVHSDKRFEIGDTVGVHYYGMVMESYPAQVHTYDVTKDYNMSLDEARLIPENAEEMGFDIDVFSRYFCHDWAGGYIISNESPDTADDPVCFEMEDGYFLGYYNSVAAEVCFIPKSCPEILFHYYVDDLTVTQKRNEGYAPLAMENERYDSVNEMSYPNGFGAEVLAHLMGFNYGEIYDEITDSYTDAHGTVWKHRVSNLFVRKPYVMSSYGKTGAKIVVLYSTADSIDEYWKKSDESVLVDQYFLHTIEFNGDRYEIVSTQPCDEDGNVTEDVSSESDKGTVTINSVFAYGDFYVSLDYVPIETETGIIVTEPVLSVTEENRTIRYENFEILNLGLLSGHEMPKRSRPVLREVQLESGSAFALMIPETAADGSKIYNATFYLYKDKELHKFDSAGLYSDFYPVLSDTQVYYPEATDVITLVAQNGAAYSYHFDCETMEVTSSPIIAQAGYNYIYFDKADAGMDGMNIAVPHFFGSWGNGDEVLKITLYESPFTSQDPMVGCYEDEKGYFMLGEDRAWYIAKDDPEMLYYFDNVTDGQRIDTEECTACYRGLELDINNGVYGGNGEMGYLGLLDLCYSLGYESDSSNTAFDVSDFFDMEITDENGTRWVRTADKNVDWGGVYNIYINGEEAYCLKMQNASDPSEFRYFSFFFSVSGVTLTWDEEQGAFRTDSEEAVLTWTDEHYCFDLSVCNTKELSTEYAEQSEIDATQNGHGYFMVGSYFYPCDDGSYYAERVMGNNQAQWLSDSELFYNDGSGYQLVSDEIGNTDTHSIGDKLYVVHNTDDGIALSIFSGMELIDTVEIADGGQIVQMGTWVKVRGDVISIEYYDSEYFSETGGANVTAYYYTETGELERIVLD